MQHVCVAQVPQRPEPRECLLLQGVGIESAPPDRRGGVGWDSDRDHSLWDPPHHRQLLQVPPEIPLGVGQLLAVSGAQPLVGAIEVGAAVQGVEQTGYICPVFWGNLDGGASRSSVV